MTMVTEMGGTILPPIPAFYHRPRSIEDIIDQTVGKVLDQFDIRMIYSIGGKVDDTRRLERIVIRYMDSFTTMTLACCAEERPWAADVFYARQRLDLIFFSSPTSHIALLFRRPRGCRHDTRRLQGEKKSKDYKWKARRTHSGRHG